MSMFTNCRRTVALLTATALVSVCALARAQNADSRGGAVGVVSHLNLVSDKSEDISSPEAWKKTYIKPGMSDQDKAIAIFNTMVRYRHQANPPREYLSSGEAGGHVHDPLKSAHVYGYGQCCCASAEVMGLARYLGFQVRGRDITAHSVPEIFYNNSWHLVDASVMNYHIKDDGKLASVDEIHEAVVSWLKDHPELAGNDKALRTFAKNGGWKKGPALLAKSDQFYGPNGVNTAGWHGWPSTMQEYYKVQGPTDFCTTMGYQLNVQLRPGEKITRNFFSRGIDYANFAQCDPNYYKELLNRKLLGIQTKLGDRAPGRIGDGTVEWNVPMTLPQLQACALSTENLAASHEGIGLADASKPGVLVLRFPCSYVYTKGQATVRATVPDGGAVAVSFSDNNGLDWKLLGRIGRMQGGQSTYDLTPLVQRRYDYRLKFELTGQGTSIEAIKSVDDFQCSQAALPMITEGANKITFNAGPQEGTITIEGGTDATVAREHHQLAIADFHPALRGFGENLAMTQAAGDATFTVTTPGDMTRLRISPVWRARDPQDALEVQVSFDGGKSFKTVPNGKLAGGTRCQSGYLILDGIPTGTRAAQVRLAGKQASATLLFDLRIDADYKEPAGAFQPVKITYLWDEAGQQKQDVHVAKRPSEVYTITCGPKAVVKSYTMELAQ